MNSTPYHLAQYMSLADFFDELGLQICPEWTGQEIGSAPIVPYPEALKLRDELNAKTAELTKITGRSEVEYIDRLVSQNELTGDLDNDPKFRRLVYRIDKLRTDLLSYPSLQDKADYETAYSIFARKQLVLERIRDLLAQEALPAVESTYERRRAVEGDVWGAKSVHFNLEDGSVRVGSRELVNVSFRIDDARRIISSLAGRAVTAGKAEADAKKRLISMMNGGEARRTKSEAWKELKSEFPGLSDRGFERAWTSACKATGSGWNKAGRPRGVPVSLQNQRAKSPRNPRGN